MNLNAVRKFCAAMPHANADIKWGADYVYSIGGKMFALAFLSQTHGRFVSFKVDDDLFLSMTAREGIVPAPYLARAKWVQVTDLKKVSDTELKAWIKRSYDMVAMKLTKKQRTAFGMS
jgi:predicted DNA-binding protein (MmcQ/YjbR family)